MNTNLSLSEQLTRTLLQEMRTGSFAQSPRLAPEKDLSERFGVSRSVVRDAMGILEREGFISRKCGVGTVINHHVLAIENRMDMEQEFLDEVKSIGRVATSRLLKAEETTADEEVAHALGIAVGTAVLEVQRLVLADQTPAILCSDFVVLSRVQDHSYTMADLEKPVFYFLERFCRCTVHMNVSRVRAVPAQTAVAKALDVAFASPLLHMAEVGYTFAGEAVLLSKEYYADDIFQHTLIRKKI